MLQRDEVESEPLTPKALGEVEAAASERDALSDTDLHLALYICFELHYQGFEGIDAGWEWSIPLLQLRRVLDEEFSKALSASLPDVSASDPMNVGELLFELERSDDGPSLSRYLAIEGTREEFAEFAIHRSAYQLKEADPHSWAIPRLGGGAKAALVEIQSDEYGGGRPERVHSFLFAQTMDGLRLDPRPNAYLGRLPGTTLATVNLMSSLGLSRARRGGIVGHLAMIEMTSSRPNRRYANGLKRLGLADPETIDFYVEHVEADAVHENIAAYDMAGALARQEPALAEDVLKGARSLLLLDRKMAEHLLDCWGDGESSLRELEHGIPRLM